jgi:glutathionylspermidine synthase
MTALIQKRQINSEHEEKRQALYSKVKGEFWHDLKSTEEENTKEPYALMDVYAMTVEQVKEVKEVTEKISGVYDKTAQLLRQLPDDSLAELGFPKLSIPFLREKVLPVEGVIRRIDLVQTKDGGWKHYEINADTPTFIMECHRVNGVVAKHFGYYDANGGCEKQLSEAIQKYISFSCKESHAPKIVFTGVKEDAEDWGTISYLAEISGLPCELIPLEELRFAKGLGLLTPGGEKIDVLYRQTYPIEYLIEDRSEKGTLVGVELMKLVQEGKLSVINPLSSFLLQSKAVQAVIWGLYEENHIFFTEDEHNTIEKHFIPTYLSSDVFIQKGQKFVQKPVFGREGDTIVVYDENGNALNANPMKSYNNHLKIYQEYIELPKKEIMTPYGKTSAHILFGSFVIGDEAGAIGIRVGEAITGNESCFLPVGIINDFN